MRGDFKPATAAADEEGDENDDEEDPDNDDDAEGGDVEAARPSPAASLARFSPTAPAALEGEAEEEDAAAPVPAGAAGELRGTRNLSIIPLFEGGGRANANAVTRVLRDADFANIFTSYCATVAQGIRRIIARGHALLGNR
jgi:hypothetical protein